MMKKEDYLCCCYDQLLKIFEPTKLHIKDDKQKFRTEGFIHAGKMLGVITNEDAVSIMEQAHFKVFGVSIDARRNRKVSLKEAVARGDDDFINIPAYERSNT